MRAVNGARRAAAGLGGAALLAGLAAGPASALAAGTDSPASLSETDILRWVAAHTSITRGSILSVGPQAVIALERNTGATGGVASAEVREELVGTDLAARAQARSVRITLELDCATRRFRILGRTLFALPDLQGQGRDEAGAQTWTAVVESAPIGLAWKAVCTQGFVFPYAGAPRPAAAPPVRAVRPVAPPMSGAYQALLGSYAVPTNAQGAAGKLTRGFGEALAGRRPRISSVVVGGKSYAAVTVAPFASAAEAGDFCARIKPSGLVCVIKRRDAGAAR